MERIEAAIALAGLLAIAVIGYSIHMMSSTVRQLRPLVQVSNDIEVMISAAHLWFEEGMKGDKSIDLNAQVYGNIDGAIASVQDLRTRIHAIEPKLFPQIEGRFDALASQLSKWRKQTTARWKDPTAGVAGSPADQAYDELFREIMRLCDANKRTIDGIVLQRQKVLTRINSSLIAFLLFVFTTLVIVAVRYRHAMQAKNLTVMKLSQAVEQTDDLVTITDKEGLIEYVNPAFEKLTGLTSGEVIGHKPSVLKSGEHPQEFYETLWQMIIAGKVFRAEIINKKKDGELYYEEKTISPIRDEQGNITHYVSTGKDITERKRIEKELSHSREMKVIGQLASGVAHEVRNPLNAILAISEAMFHDFSDRAEYTEYLNHIRTQVNRLSSLMRDLLELGKPIPECSKRMTPLLTLCKSSIDLWKQSHPSYSYPVRLIHAGNGDAQILANRGKLQQVFVNLLDNAAEHSPPGGEIRIRIEKLPPKQVQICVQDDGPGIADEKPERFFEPFFTTRKSGTGLGLTIVKHIVESHGGTVSIHSNDPPPGCCVEMILPLNEYEATNTAHG